MISARRIKFSERSVPLALLALCGLSYALLAGRLGFYWDDWPTIWYLHRFGPAGFLQVFAEDRPLLGWLFVATTGLLGKSALAWQLFAVLMRWLSALAFWGVLRRVWPNHPQQAAWAAALFAVYPGFGQQYIAVTYSHDWLIMAGFFFSLSLMMDAVPLRRSTWPIFALSWLLAAYVMFADEYYFGLELLRPILLYIALTRAAGAKSSPAQPEPAPAGQTSSGLLRRALPLDRQVAIQAGLYFSPYALLMGVFLVWRLFIHVSPRGKVQVLSGADAPLQALLNLAGTILYDLVETAGLAWAQILNFLALSDFNPLQIALYALLIVGVLGLSLLYLGRLQAESAAGWGGPAVLLGVFALAISGWPFWMTGLPIELKFPWDRFTLPFIFGASLLLAGLVDLLAGRRWVKVGLLSLVIALAAGWHFQTAMHYRLEWNFQRVFFWQLTWRAPWIEPGTALLISELPFTYYTDNSLTAPLNWIYMDPAAAWLETGATEIGAEQEMAYLLVDVPVRLGGALPSLQPGETIEQRYRTTTFRGSTSQALAMFYRPPRCLKILSPAFDLGTPNRTEHMLDATRLSDPAAWINPANAAAPAAAPPLEVLGPEPPHDWCYYFQKAELARQMGDWQAIVALGDQGLPLSSRLLKDAAAELAPFIEGYAQAGDWDKALELTGRSVKMQPKMKPVLCADWKRIVQAGPSTPAPAAALSAAAELLACQGL